MRRFFPALFLLFGVCSIDWAGDAPGVGDDSASERLARTEFPLGEGESFAAELTQLEAVLAAKIAHPAPDDYTHDRVYGHELYRVFQLVECWPSEAFRKPLTDFYPSADICVIPCARALLNYEDPALRRLVETRRDFSVTGGYGCIMFHESVDDQLATERLYFERFDSEETVIPPIGHGDIDWPENVTVAKAVRLLGDGDLSIQLQSWLWLAEHGIIAPTECVRDNWSILTWAQKWYVLGSVDLDNVDIGLRRFERLCDELYEIESGALRDELWLLRGKMGNQTIRARARQILQAELKRGIDSERLNDGEISRALNVTYDSPMPDDVPILLTLVRLPDEFQQHMAALAALCQIDDPTAIHEVGQFLLKPREFDFMVFIRYLRFQAPKQLKHRNHYLIVFARALQTLPADSAFYPYLIENFELMSGRDFGDNGLMTSPLAVNKKVARETGRKCVEWLAKNQKH